MSFLPFQSGGKTFSAPTTPRQHVFQEGKNISTLSHWRWRRRMMNIIHVADRITAARSVLALEPHRKRLLILIVTASASKDRVTVVVHPSSSSIVARREEIARSTQQHRLLLLIFIRTSPYAASTAAIQHKSI